MEESTEFLITDIRWHNMFLDIAVRSEAENARFILYGRDPSYDVCIIARSEVRHEDGMYYIRINIPAAAGRSFLDDGEWLIKAVIGAGEYQVPVTVETAYRFQDLSRVFRYDDDKAYVITFEPDVKISAENKPDYSIEDKDWKAESEYIDFYIVSSFMKNNPDWHDKADGVRNVVYRTLNKASEREHAPGKKHVLFMTETRDDIAGNLKAVYDEVKKRGLDKMYTVSVYARNDVKLGLGVNGLIRLRKLIADQDIIFVDDFVPVFSYLDPPEGARLIQLWHACVGFKSVGYSRFGKIGSPHPAWSCHRKYTDVFVPHENLKDVYREVFGIEKNAFKVVGSPRLDGFTDKAKIEDAKKRILEKYPFINGKKVILFAPTYRGAGEQAAYYDESMLDFGKIAKICKDETVFLIKMHPFVEKKVDIPEEYKDVIYDVTDYPDINELYHLTDILITDYSSDYFEFALLRKPILFYTYDRDRYQLLRGVHQDVKETAPGKVCDTFDELAEALESEDFDIEKTERFADEYASVLEGSAAAKVVDEVFR